MFLAAVLVAVCVDAVLLLMAAGADREPELRQVLSRAQTPVSVDDGAVPVSRSTGEPAAISTVHPPPPVPARGDGVLTAVDVPALVWAQTGRRVTFSVEAEGGVGVDAAEFAATVANVLSDVRGWQAVDGVMFVPVPAAHVAVGTPVDVRVTLASPGLTDELCAPLQTHGDVSCWNGQRAVVNAKRWVHGAATYGSDLAAYRVYVVNHEVGHGLGHGHVECAGPGQPAAVMVQQTLGLGGCLPWQWPSSP